MDDLISSGLYDQEAANSFLEQSQHYTATCVSALYDHVVDMKCEVNTIIFTLWQCINDYVDRMQCCSSVRRSFICGSWSKVRRLVP